MICHAKDQNLISKNVPVVKDLPFFEFFFLLWATVITNLSTSRLSKMLEMVLEWPIYLDTKRGKGASCLPREGNWVNLLFQSWCSWCLYLQFLI